MLDAERERETETETETETDRQTDRQSGRHARADRQTDTDRQRSLCHVIFNAASTPTRARRCADAGVVQSFQQRGETATLERSDLSSVIPASFGTPATDLSKKA